MIEAVAALLSLLAFRALLTLVSLVAVGTAALGGLDELLIAVILVGMLAALRALVLEAGAAFAEHAEIMVRILKIIFGLHAVARELRVARHALVLFQELGGIAALAIVLTVTRLSAEIPPSTLSPTTAPAAALSVVDQVSTSLRSELPPFGIGQQGRCFQTPAPDPLVPVCA
jgi:hypothetical protein